MANEDGEIEEAALLSHDPGGFADTVYRICNKYERKRTDMAPSKRI